MNQEFDSVSLPLPPTVERFGEIFTLIWTDRNVRMVIDRFDKDRHQNVSAEISVTVLDAPEGENHITRGRAGLLSTFKTIIDDAVDFGGEALSFLLADAPAGINCDNQIAAADASQAGEIISPPEMTPGWLGQCGLLTKGAVKEIGQRFEPVNMGSLGAIKYSFVNGY